MAAMQSESSTMHQVPVQVESQISTSMQLHARMLKVTIHGAWCLRPYYILVFVVDFSFGSCDILKLWSFEKNVVKWFLSEAVVERINFNTSFLGKQWTRIRRGSKIVFCCCFRKVVMRSAHHIFFVCFISIPSSVLNLQPCDCCLLSAITTLRRKFAVITNWGD